MKIGTDGILLGAWADVSEKKKILDVGSGCGLIALMLAQRTELLESKIVAIDIEPSAVELSKENFASSPWSDRLVALRSSFQDFSRSSGQKDKTYDLIVCNPPFFESGPPSPQENRRVARHVARLSRRSLFQSAASVMSEAGILSLIIPWAQADSATRIAESFDLFLYRQTCVRPLPNDPFKRVLLEFGLENRLTVVDELTVEEVHLEYTEAFRDLTAEFYLRFADQDQRS